MIRLQPYPCWLEIVERAPDDERVLAMTISNGPMITVLIGPEAGKAEIVHESEHVRQCVEEYIGCRLDDESAAYLVQRIFELIVKKISNEEKKKKVK